MTRLFRDEVLAERQSSFLGSIRIGRPPSFAVVTGVSCLLATALVGYGWFGEMTRKARLTGLLVPTQGTIALSVPQAGTVTDIRVKEGDSVAANQVLMTIGIDRSTLQGDTAVLVAQNLEQRRATMRAERSIAEMQFRQRQEAAVGRAHSLESEARQAEAELDGAKRREELAKKSVDRYAELARSGFVSEIQAQQKQEELLDLVARESVAERSLIALRRDEQALRAEQAANASALQSQIVQIDRNMAALDQEGAENSGRRELVVTAPQAGSVTALIATRGQLVQPGQTLVNVVPGLPDGKPSPLEAQLFAPSRTAGFVQPGQTVWLRYAAYPFQKFGMAHGTITGVSRSPLAAQDLPSGQGQAILSAAQTNEPTYRVTVALPSQDIRTYGQVQPLKPGMALDADVVQERRRIWEWLLEPVFAASGLSGSMAGAAK